MKCWTCRKQIVKSFDEPSCIRLDCALTLCLCVLSQCSKEKTMNREREKECRKIVLKFTSIVLLNVAVIATTIIFTARAHIHRPPFHSVWSTKTTTTPTTTTTTTTAPLATKRWWSWALCVELWNVYLGVAGGAKKKRCTKDDHQVRIKRANKKRQP